MQIDRHVHRLGTLEDRPKSFVIEEGAVREPVNHRALETELGRAFELIRRRLGIAGGQRCERRESLGVRSNDRVQTVIDPPGQLDRVRAGKLLCRGRTVREDLHIDAGLVHLAQAQLAEIVEAVEHVGSAHALPAREPARELLVPIVLLDGDDGTFRPLEHDAYLPKTQVWLLRPYCRPQDLGTSGHSHRYLRNQRVVGCNGIKDA